MICVYFIGGSHFTRNIQPSPEWVTQFKNRGYVIKCARVADLDTILNECSVFVDTCKHKYTDPTNTEHSFNIVSKSATQAHLMIYPLCLN